MPADGAEGICSLLFRAHAHAFAIEIEMRPVHIHMRHFAIVQPQPVQDHLGIRQQAASAQFRTRVAGFFQDQGARHQFRRHLRQVESSGDPGWAGS